MNLRKKSAEWVGDTTGKNGAPHEGHLEVGHGLSQARLLDRGPCASAPVA